MESIRSFYGCINFEVRRSMRDPTLKEIIASCNGFHSSFEYGIEGSVDVKKAVTQQLISHMHQIYLSEAMGFIDDQRTM